MFPSRKIAHKTVIKKDFLFSYYCKFCTLVSNDFSHENLHFHRPFLQVVVPADVQEDVN